MWIYESHMGGLFVVDRVLSPEEEYCETCGDYDSLIGFAESKSLAESLLDDIGYARECIEEFLDDYFKE